MPESPLSAAPAPSRVRYLVLAGLCAVAMITYIQRQSFGIVELEIREELGLTKRQSGWLASGLFATYALLQVPGGRIGQIWGSRRALSVYGGICSAATLLLAIPASLPGIIGGLAGFPSVLAARMGIGLGQAGVFPCTTTVVKAWLPVNRLALANGLITTMMQVGAIIAAVLTGWLAPQIGWRNTFALFAIPGIAWSIWFYVWFRDRPRDHPSVNAGELALLNDGPSVAEEPDESQRPAPIPWAALLSSLPLFWICAQQFFRGAGYSFYGNWFTTFLREGKKVPGLAQAGFLTMLPIVGTALGSFAGGWLSDRVLHATGKKQLARQGISAASQFASALVILAAYPVEDPLTAVTIISIGSFFAAIAGPVSYTVTIEMGGRHVPTVFGLMNMWGNIGAFVFPHAVAWLVGEGTDANWDPVLFLFAGIYVAAALCWLAFDARGTIVGEDVQ